MQDAADHPPVIDPPSTWPAMRQVRLDHHPSFVTQPEEIVHGSLRQCPRGCIESKSTRQINPLIRFRP